MQSPTIAADEAGIHFLHDNNDIVVVWGEIAQICGIRHKHADGTTYIEVFIVHYSGVDFRFQSIEPGYEQTTAEMERHLIGFNRSSLELVRSLEEEQTIPVVWTRDEAIQPFRFQPPVADTRDPTPQEHAQMQAAHEASIATCERILGRALKPEEIECVKTGFENGRIVGSIAPPLSNLLIEKQKVE